MMSVMRGLVVIAVLAACSPERAGTAVPGQSGPMGRNAEIGSALEGSGAASVGQPLADTWPLAKPPPPPPKTPAQLAAALEACVGHFNANAIDKLGACYGGSAVVTLAGAAVPSPALVGPANIEAQVAAERPGHPDVREELLLVLASEHDVIAIALVAGTHTGVVGAGPDVKHGGFDAPLRDAPATNKPFGFLAARVLGFDELGRIDADTRYLDGATQLGQVGIAKSAVRPVATAATAWPGGKQVLVAGGSDAERANQIAYGRFNEALNRHDAGAIGDLLADGAVWSEQARPTDFDKKGYLAHLAQQWRIYSDLRFGALKVWSAGDYVVAVENFTGRNDGDRPPPTRWDGPIPRTMAQVTLPTLAVYRFTAGKIAHAWTFHQSTGLAAQLVRPKKSE
jgi:predicted ester cyclase